MNREISRLQLVQKLFVRNTLLTILWCVLMFVIVPLGVYTLSYIPFMMVPGPGHGSKRCCDVSGSYVQIS